LPARPQTQASVHTGLLQLLLLLQNPETPGAV